MHMMLSIGDMRRNGIQHHADPIYLIFILLNLYFIVCSNSTNFNLVLILINFDIVHLFLSLNLKMILILLTLFA